MTQSNVGVSTGTDKFLAANARSVGGTALQEQVVLMGQSADPTYNVIADDVSVAAASSHLIQIMADGTLYTRLNRLTVQPTEDLPASSSVLKVGLYRLTVAGTSGSALSDAPYDTADSYGGDMRSLPTIGTEGQLLWVAYLGLDSGPASGGANDIPFVWTPPPGGKPIIFGVGTGNGIALKVIDAVASASVVVNAEISTTTYL